MINRVELTGARIFKIAILNTTHKRSRHAIMLL